MEEGILHSLYLPNRKEEQGQTVSKIMVKNKKTFSNKRVVAIIPAYKPQATTYALIDSLLTWYENIQVVIVDDSTPSNSDAYKVIMKIKNRAKKERRLTYLRTPENKLKAGALNYALSHLWEQEKKPHVVVTFDDDVIITPETLYYMVGDLYSKKNIGAVCSKAYVINKNVNILTRLQALEYQSFNITKIADNGFLKGPLVMQGMLSAFRMKAMQEVGGFTVGHLIEDYDLTVRLKRKGWKVGISQRAEAWTDVPETFAALWKQRVRWGYGGLQVLKEYWKNVSDVFQDVLGHALFIILFALIILSFIFGTPPNQTSFLTYGLLATAIGQFVVSFILSVIVLKTHKDKDLYDWILKLTLIPEFIYSNILSFVLIGSYLYFAYNHTIGTIAKRVKLFVKPYELGLKGFQKIGYSLAWGTRAN